MATSTDMLHTSLKLGRGFWTGALLSTCIGVLLYSSAARVIEQDARTRFGYMARNIQSTLDMRIKAYVDLLRGTASLYRTTDEVTREQFRNYVEGLDLAREYPGVEAINFGLHFPDTERENIESKVLQNIDGQGRRAKIMPEGRRDEYTVLTFIEPGSKYIDRIGFDILTRPNAGKYLEYMRDTGEVLSSGLPLKIGSRMGGLTMRIPVYRGLIPIKDVNQRRAAYIGTVGIGFSVDSLAHGVLDSMPPNATRLRISGDNWVTKLSLPTAGVTSVFYDNRVGETLAKEDQFHVHLPVGLGGRKWLMEVSVVKRSMYSTLDSLLPWVALLVGMAGTAMLYALFQTLSTSRRRAICIAEDMTKELRASESKLRKTNDNLRRLAAHAESIKESERKRIAREIHDDLGQNMLALRIEIDMLVSRTERQPLLQARAKLMLSQIDATVKSVRQIINDLRPHVLDLGLMAAIDWQIVEFEKRHGVRCELADIDYELHVSDRCSTTLFRILQESLTNVSRHAQATAVLVEIAANEDAISMAVSDNGIGLAKAGGQKPGSFGLVGIEERVRIMGGTCVITSVPTKGTKIHVTLPAATNVMSIVPIPASERPPASTPDLRVERYG